MNGAAIQDVLPGILFSIIVVVFSLSLHETAHGYVAYKLGDPTARNLGRLTLNPKKHLDPIGTICMILFGFGWAKPVPVYSRNFRKPKYGMALSCLAGPLSNILLSFVALIIMRVIWAFSVPAFVFYFYNFSGDAFTFLNYSVADKILSLFGMLMYYFHIMNLYLAIFNFLPIPPLDGSRILFVLLPDRIYFKLMQYERYIFLALLALLWTGVLSTPLSYLAGVISNGMHSLLDLIPFLDSANFLI